jgi:plastocyanin
VKGLKIGIGTAAAALLLASCGGGSGGDNGGGSSCNATGGASGATAAQTVKINSDPNTVGRYDPKSVSVKTGESVEWDWVDNGAKHSVTADDSSFDSCLQSAGSKFTVTFSKAGDFTYHCTIHSQMTGEIKVS